MKKRVIVLGSNGMAGHVIALMLMANPELYEVINIARTNSTKLKPNILLDVTNFCELNNIISRIKPDYIVNCVGILNKKAEYNPANSILINSYLPHFIEEEVKNTFTRLIHISTDCVFSGIKGSYHEFDPKDGIGYYAQSKALGEIINEKDLTIRTSIIGPELNKNGIGLFHWFQRQTGEISGYYKALWSGVTTIELAKIILNIINGKDLTGLLHLTNNQKISKYFLLNLLKMKFGRNDILILRNDDYIVDKSLVQTRKDIHIEIPSYEIMIDEMRDWIQNHSYFYEYPA